MRIVQKAGSDQLLIITGAHLLFQIIKNSQLFQIIKGTMVIIEPGVHHIDPVHESLGEGTEICFPETEFGGIDARHQRFPVQAFFHDPLQFCPDHLYEAVFLFRIGIFRCNAEHRLQSAAVIGTADVFSNAGIQKSLL